MPHAGICAGGVGQPMSLPRPGQARTIVSRRGKNLVAVIPIEDLRLLERPLLTKEKLYRIHAGPGK
jgi:hypothetical protein